MSKVLIAACRDDDEPLVLTFEVAYKEFLCMVCGRRYEYLEPKPLSPTLALAARLDELKALYDAGVRP